MQDCHVINYLSKEQHDGRSAALVVGGKNVSPFYVRKSLSWTICAHTWGSEPGSVIKWTDIFHGVLSFSAAPSLQSLWAWSSLFVFDTACFFWGGGFVVFFALRSRRKLFSVKPETLAPRRPLALHQTPGRAERSYDSPVDITKQIKRRRFPAGGDEGRMQAGESRSWWMRCETPELHYTSRELSHRYS